MSVIASLAQNWGSMTLPREVARHRLNTFLWLPQISFAITAFKSLDTLKNIQELLGLLRVKRLVAHICICGYLFYLVFNLGNIFRLMLRENLIKILMYS
jgi:hypothetical protein